MIILPVAHTAHLKRRPVVTLSLIGVTSAVWLATAFTPGPRAPVERYASVVEQLERALAHPYETRDGFELRLASGLVLPKSSAAWRTWRNAYRESEAALVNAGEWLSQRFGFVPEQAPDHRLLTSLFLHGDFMHLLMNMVFLFLVGCNVEDQWGRGRFALFYLAGGVAANVAHALAMRDSDLPLVGASGAVAAVMAAFVVFHALVRIRFFWWLILFGFFELPAIVPIGAWLAFQLYDAFASPDAVVAYWAHIGGFAFGLLVAVPVRLWGGPVQRAPATPRPRAEAGPDDLGAQHHVSLPGANLMGGDWMIERALKAGEAALEQADGAAARASFEEVLRKTPGHPEARWGLLRALRMAGARREADTLGEALIADLTRDGRTEEARRVYSLLMR